MKKFIPIIFLFLSSCKEGNDKPFYCKGNIVEIETLGTIWDTQEIIITLSNNEDISLSIDRDNSRKWALADSIKVAFEKDTKVVITYYRTGNNWYHNRGETNKFITDVKYLPTLQ